MISITTQKALDISFYSNAGTFIPMRPVSSNMVRPIVEHLYCFNNTSSENQTSRDLNNSDF
mgnify:CR=1 FL=1